MNLRLEHVADFPGALNCGADGCPRPSLWLLVGPTYSRYSCGLHLHRCAIALRTAELVAGSQ